MIIASLDHFHSEVEAALEAWLAGQPSIEKVGRKISGDRLRRLKALSKVLNRLIREADGLYDIRREETMKKEELKKFG